MIDVVIVHYPCARDVVECVETLGGRRGPVGSVTIVENGAPERVPAELDSHADVVTLPDNVGFARAANLGARRGTADHLLFVNPDVRVTADVLSELLATCADPRTGAASPALVLPDGRPQVGVGGYLPGWRSILAEHVPRPARLPRGAWPEPFFFKAPLVRPDSAVSRKDLTVMVDWLCGACLLARRDAFERVGGFDESFFLYGEDVDLGHRLKGVGYRLALRTDLIAEHRHVMSTGLRARRAASTVWLDGVDRYYRKHRPWARRGLHAVAALGFAARFVAYGLGLSRPRSPGDDAVRRVASFAWRSTSLAVWR